MVTQMVRVQHAEIGISSPAVSLSSASLFLTMLPFCSSFYWFLGLIVHSLALCPCPWVLAILYALTGCGSPVAHSHIHWLTKAGLQFGTTLRGNLGCIVLHRSGQILHYDCIISNVSFLLCLICLFLLPFICQGSSQYTCTLVQVYTWRLFTEDSTQDNKDNP